MKRSSFKANPEKVRAWQYRSRKPLKTNTRLKATRLRKVGKVGKANIASRKKIAEIAESKGLERCEIRLESCTVTWPLAPAHRHKRAWYKGNADLLADEKQWVAACQNCHDQIEHNSKLTEEIFIRLRGE